MSEGYRHPDYAASFADQGVPRLLPRCGGWLLERRIAGTDARDAMGCYPLFACGDWSRLGQDLDALQQALVSVVLVTDPFGDYDEPLLREAFDRVIPFKEHFVADLRRPLSEIVTRDRQRCARSAHRRGVRVEECPDPVLWIDDWMVLYEQWATQHAVRGIHAYTRDTFLRQLAVPGMVMLRAVHENVTVAIGLFALHGQVAYAHLVAFGEAGYNLRASCALYMGGIDLLADRVRWIDWGGNAGMRDDPDDGLGRFKSGWSSDRRTAYLCTRALDPVRYDALVDARGTAGAVYFPAYRSDEAR